MTEKEYIEESAKTILHTRLNYLAKWCSERAKGKHNTITTLSLLNQKVQDVEQATLRAVSNAAQAYPLTKGSNDN